jgi:hypothetical protein
MRIRRAPWRFLMPGIILPLSLIAWLRYYTSVRVSDDSPPPWFWYGSPFTAWINLPAFVYSAPARLLGQAGLRGVRVGRAWVEPRTAVFFLLIALFWYWVGIKVEGHAASIQPRSRIRRVSCLMLYALGAGLWILIAVGSTYDLIFMWHVPGWYMFPRILDSGEFYVSSRLIWGVVLGTYFVLALVRLWRTNLPHTRRSI